MSYLKTNQKEVEDFSEQNLSHLYNQGYVFTRLGKGVMNQTRSLRINLENFRLNSENKRILRKTEEITCEFKNLPLENYSWEIHKLGKDFYSRKFGSKTMSASKIKAMFNNLSEENMNSVFIYSAKDKDLGYCLSYKNSEILHYSYPFYNLDYKNPNLGMGMMVRAVVWAKENDLQFIYLGSITSEKAKYKLQFKGIEWFDVRKEDWSEDLGELKGIVSSNQ